MKKVAIVIFSIIIILSLLQLSSTNAKAATMLSPIETFYFLKRLAKAQNFDEVISIIGRKPDGINDQDEYVWDMKPFRDFTVGVSIKSGNVYYATIKEIIPSNPMEAKNRINIVVNEYTKLYGSPRIDNTGNIKSYDWNDGSNFLLMFLTTQNMVIYHIQ